MKGSSAPAAPDPSATINAQAQANRVNIETPYGNNIYGKYVANDKPADVSDADWNARSFTDRYRFEVDPSHAVMQVQESPEVKAYRERMTGVAQSLGNRAQSMIDSLPTSALRFSNGFSAGSEVRPSPLPGGTPRMMADAPERLRGGGPQMASSPVDFARVGLPASGISVGDANPSRMPGNTSWNGLPGYTGAIDFSGAPKLANGLNGTVRSGINRAGLDTASGIRGDVDSMFAGRPDAVTSIDRTGLPQINSSVDRTGLGDYERINFNGLPQLAGVGDYSADRDKVSSDVFARAKSLLDPDIQQQRRRLEQRLADQGIPVGSEAWNSAIGNLERGTNDQLGRLALDATTAGGAEQSRLAGLSSSARSQLFGERQADVSTANAARAARFGENLSDASLGNSARGQAFGERTTDAGLQNDARAKALAEALAYGGFRGGLQNQDFTQRQADLDAENRAREQQLGENSTLRSAYINELTGNADRQNAARTQGINEQMTERQNAFNELAALLGGPQVQGAPMMTPTPIDVTGPMALQYQGQLANWQASQARQNSLMGAGAGLAGAWLGRR